MTEPLKSLLQTLLGFCSECNALCSKKIQVLCKTVYIRKHVVNAVGCHGVTKEPFYLNSSTT